MVFFTLNNCWYLKHKSLTSVTQHYPWCQDLMCDVSLCRVEAPVSQWSGPRIRDRWSRRCPLSSAPLVSLHILIHKISLAVELWCVLWSSSHPLEHFLVSLPPSPDVLDDRKMLYPGLCDVIWSLLGPNSDSFIKCWRAGACPVSRPGGQRYYKRWAARQPAATRHTDHDPAAKRWMKFWSSLNYANFCTRQHSPTSLNCWDFIPSIPSLKYKIPELLTLMHPQSSVLMNVLNLLLLDLWVGQDEPPSIEISLRFPLSSPLMSTLSFL